MDTNDFLGSFAQENVAFTTQIIRPVSVGDNYWKVMVFVENDRFVDSTTEAWVAVPGSSTLKALTVTASDYASYTSGLLRSWLYDLFANGFTGDCILVACANKPGEEGTNEAFITAMDNAYELMKAYAYHKTVCAGGDDALSADIATELAKLCAPDKGLLSSAPYYPYSTPTPSQTDSDTIYSAVKASGFDAFFAAHQDKTRNAALYSLGLAMATVNGSGTCVGNSFDMIKSANITSSGPDGTNLPKTARDSLKRINIQFFKPVGDNTGNVAATGAQTINGDVIQATWILAYVTYMTKVKVAQLLTTPNFLKNSTNYTRILNLMSEQLTKFGSSGSGRLKNLQITAPAFGTVASKADVIIIPEAWSASYVDQVREVQITGTLYIGE